MKILVIGNCQARPICTFLAAMCPELQFLEPVVVHLAKDANESSNHALCDQADVIFTQPVQDNYPVAHLRTDTLRKKYDQKVVSWPNCFFSGQSPDVVCIASPDAPRLTGPLDTYHIRTIFHAWQQNIARAQCVDMLETAQQVLESDMLADSDRSLAELQAREATTDVGISDYIEANWKQHRLFHVFNHPVNRLLIELAARMASHAGLPVHNQLSADFWSEALNRVIPPSLPSVHAALGLAYQGNASSKGFVVNSNASGLVLGEQHIYPLPDLVEQFYICYDAQLSRTSECRFTPGYLNPRSLARAA